MPHVGMTKRCSGCNEDKPQEDFRWKSKARGERVSLCRTCDAKYRQQRYDPDHQRVSQTRWDETRRQKVASGLREALTKECVDCRQVLCTDEFRWKDRRKGLRVGRCSTCDAQWRRRDYQRKSEAYRARIDRLHSALRLIVEEAKRRPCMDCGNEYAPYVMDFDHRDPSQKIDKVSNIMRFGSRKRLLAEIAKCDLVCANCHRERTSRQMRRT